MRAGAAAPSAVMRAGLAHRRGQGSGAGAEQELALAGRGGGGPRPQQHGVASRAGALICSSRALPHPHLLQ